MLATILTLLVTLVPIPANADDAQEMCAHCFGPSPCCSQGPIEEIKFNRNLKGVYPTLEVERRIEKYYGFCTASIPPYCSPDKFGNEVTLTAKVVNPLEIELSIDPSSIRIERLWKDETIYESASVQIIETKLEPHSTTVVAIATFFDFQVRNPTVFELRMNVVGHLQNAGFRATAMLPKTAIEWNGYDNANLYKQIEMTREEINTVNANVQLSNNDNRRAAEKILRTLDELRKQVREGNASIQKWLNATLYPKVLGIWKAVVTPLIVRANPKPILLENNHIPA